MLLIGAYRTAASRSLEMLHAIDFEVMTKLLPHQQCGQRFWVLESLDGLGKRAQDQTQSRRRVAAPFLADARNCGVDHTKRTTNKRKKQ